MAVLQFSHHLLREVAIIDTHGQFACAGWDYCLPVVWRGFLGVCFFGCLAEMSPCSPIQCLRPACHVCHVVRTAGSQVDFVCVGAGLKGALQPQCRMLVLSSYRIVNCIPRRFIKWDSHGTRQSHMSRLRAYFVGAGGGVTRMVDGFYKVHI